MASALVINASFTEKEQYYHSRRKTADTLTIRRTETNEKNRFDAYGHLISKTKKKQRVSFIDTISPNKIAEVIVYDEYSSKEIKRMQLTNQKQNHVNCECTSCVLF